MRASFGVKGGRDVTFRANTVAGNLPSCAYAMRLNREGSNPQNQEVRFWGNVWSDPAGTMGAGCGGGNDFSDGAVTESTGVQLDRNLYWNGAQAIPPGDVLSPLVDDVRRIVADPGLNANQAGIVLPRWTGAAFPAGARPSGRSSSGWFPPTASRTAPARPSTGATWRGCPPTTFADGRGRWPRTSARTSTGPRRPRRPADPRGWPRAGRGHTLTGSNFAADASIALGAGNVPARDVFVASPSFALFTVPPLAAGLLHSVGIMNPGGGGGVILDGYFADFLDVAGDHPNHRFVEALVRRYVTGGCGAGNYCPNAPVTREQMAVFLLTSKEGLGYVPPPCVTPQFADVPCSSPFARWVNELAARGITGGCGGGNYCPAPPSPASRWRSSCSRPSSRRATSPPPARRRRFPTCPARARSRAGSDGLVARGITGGCGGGNFCPASPVTRGQMSVFLVVTFGI